MRGLSFIGLFLLTLWSIELPSFGDQVELLISDGHSFRKRVELIGDAKLTIDVSSYEIGDDDLAMQWFAHLREAARRGVSVRLITDGHNGNIVLKTIEGLATMMGGFVLGSFFTSKEAEAAYEVMRGPLRPLKTSLDPTAIGGVPLLGTDGVCVVGHGSSMSVAVASGICVAKEAVAADLVGRFKAALASQE